jgi:hypothetical protein
MRSITTGTDLTRAWGSEPVAARFVAGRLEGLADEPPPGAPRKITCEKVEQVIVATLETTPKDATYWSTRSMAEHVGCRNRR